MLSATQLKRLRAAPLDGPNRIQAAMDLLELTQVGLGEAVGFPQTYISAIVNGRYSRLPLENARRFAAHFGCHIEDLFPSREAVAS